MRTLVWIAITCLAAGCAGRPYDGAVRLPVKGKVTLDGEPVDGGVISFIPQSDSQRPTGNPVINGEFTVPEAQGANEGSYRVEILWNKPTGKQYLDKDDTGQMINEVKQIIPKKYNRESELIAEISKDKTEFQFDLLSK